MNKKIIIAIIVIMLIIASVFYFNNQTQKSDVVTLYGWGGDPRVNEWIDNELASYVKENYGIKLERVPMNIDEILTKLTNEKGSQKEGSIDVIWINGENFYYAKQNELLHGPFLDNIENAKKYLDLSGATATVDFGYPTEGYEAPWGTAQFVFVNNGSVVSNPPLNSKQLKEFVMSNPGAFTYPEAKDFVGSAFIRTLLYDMVGYDKIKDLPADYDTVKEAIMPVMDYLNEIKPYLWKEGKTYPKDSAQLDGLYQDGEVYIAMDYNANKALSKVNDGSWDKSTRTFVWEKGTPFNTHFLAIAANAPNRENAMKLINAALSPAMQISKANLTKWADLPVLEYGKLSDEDKANLDKALTPAEEFKDVILSYDELSKHKQAEIKADLVAIIEKIWEDVVLFEKQ
jgi:putative spermidine/putrescine transport system substrate-binding protein